MFRRIRMLFRLRRMEAELAEEIEFHKSMSGGCAFGNGTRAMEDARAVWLAPAVESVMQDIRYGLRTLISHGGFTCTAALALGIAIGLNTSLFTVFNATAIRPWPVKDPGRVVNVHTMPPAPDVKVPNGFSVAEFRFLNENSKMTSGFLLTRQERVRTGEDGLTRNARAVVVSGNFFDLLGIPMQLGRGFLPEEDRVDSPQAVAVLPFVKWRSEYGSDPTIVGRKIGIDGVPFTVVGVATEEFTGTLPDGTDIWIPMSSLSLMRPDEGTRRFLTDPHNCCSWLTARLAPGVTKSQAQAEIDALSTRYRRSQNIVPGSILLSSTAHFDNPERKKAVLPAFGLFFIGVFLVLALACANVGNLLLARSATRTREIAVRLSVGASRGRVIRQLITESFLVALLAGAIGVLLASELPSIVVNRLAPDGVALHLSPDTTVLAYTLAVCILSCLLFGLAPAFRATRVDLETALKQRSASERSATGMRNVLLGVQLALSVVLLVGAALMARGVAAARSMDPGFEINGVSIVNVDFPANAYTPQRNPAFWSALQDSLREFPNLAHAAITSNPPLSSKRMITAFRRQGEPEQRSTMAILQEVSPEFFPLLHLSLIAGRPFRTHEGADSVIVSKTLANRYFPNENCVGKTIISGNPKTIVGVANDAYTYGLGQYEPIIYKPFEGAGGDAMLLISSAGTHEIKAAAARLDPRVRVRVTPLSSNLERWLVGPQLSAALAGILGVFALILATIGVSGVFAYNVEQRRKEIGIRLAMGAEGGQIISMLVSAGLRAVLIGLAAGFAGAAILSRMIRTFLFGVPLLDPYAYAGVAMILALAGVIATWVPASRATRIDPMTALRYE